MSSFRKCFLTTLSFRCLEKFLITTELRLYVLQRNYSVPHRSRCCRYVASFCCRIHWLNASWFFSVYIENCRDRVLNYIKVAFFHFVFTYRSWLPLILFITMKLLVEMTSLTYDYLSHFVQQTHMSKGFSYRGFVYCLLQRKYCVNILCTAA